MLLGNKYFKTTCFLACQMAALHTSNCVRLQKTQRLEFVVEFMILEKGLGWDR